MVRRIIEIHALNHLCDQHDILSQLVDEVRRTRGVPARECLTPGVCGLRDAVVDEMAAIGL